MVHLLFYDWVRVVHHFSFVVLFMCPCVLICLCEDVLFTLFVFVYVVCVCLRMVVSNACCVVVFFPTFCVPYVASFSVFLF